jgi:chromatin segregation and condensation protein Rec8/ScpA/Scc1 (kleisin family)
MSFLAILDLYKSERVEVSQHTNFGDLVVELSPEEASTVAPERSMAAQVIR